MAVVTKNRDLFYQLLNSHFINILIWGKIVENRLYIRFKMIIYWYFSYSSKRGLCGWNTFGTYVNEYFQDVEVSVCHCEMSSWPDGWIVSGSVNVCKWESEWMSVWAGEGGNVEGRGSVCVWGGGSEWVSERLCVNVLRVWETVCVWGATRGRAWENVWLSKWVRE